MCTKLISVVSAVLVLTLTSTTLGIGIGDFENSMDRWETVDSTILTGYSTHGATLNQSSIWIETESGHIDALVLDLIENNLVDEFKNNLKISMDITRLVAEWVDVGSSYCDLYLVINAGSEGEEGSWVLEDELTENAKWNPLQGDEPKNFIYNYSLDLPEINFSNIEYLELIIGTNWGGYDPGGVYYIDNIQMFGGGAAYVPIPADGAKAIPTDATFGWTPGVYADKHDLYFGIDPEAVSDANRANIPEGVILIQDQELNSYDPDGLIPGQTYFWRIDEISDTNIWKGDIWSFTTEFPGAFVLGDWEDSMDGWYVWDNNPATQSYSTTGATLNNKSLKMSVDVPGAFIWQFGIFMNPQELAVLKANDLFSMDVTIVNDEWIGTGSWAQIMWIAINGEEIGWNQIDAPIDDTSNPEAPGDWNPADFPEPHTRTLTWDYSGIAVADIPEDGWCQFSIATNHDAGYENATYYFDNARLFNSKPASKPSPAYMETDVKTEPTLSWTTGKHAVSHNVYFGTNYNDIKDVNAANLDNYPNVTFTNIPANNYNPGLLNFNTTYFWRVDEVNDTHPEMLWPGDVWSFTTGNFIVVDDFEAYNDLNEDEEGTNRIYLTWSDGYANPSANGSTIGYPAPDFANGEHLVETDIVHGGNQSAPLLYNNTVANYSEVTLSTSEIAIGQNWVRDNLDVLSLWFYGDPNNPTTEQLYVKLNNSKIVYDGDATDITVPQWTQWDIDLSAFGINLSGVTQIGIGLDKIGAIGGEGIIFIDDIRLISPEQ